MDFTNSNIHIHHGEDLTDKEYVQRWFKGIQYLFFKVVSDNIAQKFIAILNHFTSKISVNLSTVESQF